MENSSRPGAKRARDKVNSTYPMLSPWIRAGGCSSLTAQTTASRSSTRMENSWRNGRQFGRPSGLYIDRNDIALLGGAAAWPLAASSQQAKTTVPRIGWLVTGSPTSYRLSLAAFRDGLKTLGYVEGKNIRIEYRWAEGNVARLAELANELVQQNVDVILAGGSVGAEAAKQVTSVIPIVAAGVTDLVEIGLVASLARPGGNLTGFVAGAPEAAAKRFEIIREIKPQTRRVVVLWNPTSSSAKVECYVAKEFA